MVGKMDQESNEPLALPPSHGRLVFPRIEPCPQFLELLGWGKNVYTAIPIAIRARLITQVVGWTSSISMMHLAAPMMGTTTAPLTLALTWGSFVTTPALPRR
jgi:hypothetical protein